MGNFSVNFFAIFSKKVYFCSEFVSEQLRNMKSLHLKQASNMYFPNNLAKALCQQIGVLMQITLLAVTGTICLVCGIICFVAGSIKHPK